jgi:hypothetical protein
MQTTYRGHLSTRAGLGLECRPVRLRGPVPRPTAHAPIHGRALLAFSIHVQKRGTKRYKLQCSGVPGHQAPWLLQCSRGGSPTVACGSSSHVLVDVCHRFFSSCSMSWALHKCTWQDLSYAPCDGGEAISGAAGPRLHRAMHISQTPAWSMNVQPSL